MNDLRYCFRTLCGSPAFTTVAVVLLALGIGANTAIFSVVNAVLLRPLPYQDPERLVMVWENFRALGRPTNLVSPANFLDWQAQNGVFEQMAAIQSLSLNLTGQGEPEELQAQMVSGNYFAVLGVQPALGRAFSLEEDQPAGPLVVVLSHRLWQRRFGADRGVIGRSVTLSGAPVTVIGVMGADSLVLPALGQAPEAWQPIRLDPARDYRADAGRYLAAIARLRPGVSRPQAEADMDAIARRLARQHRDFNKGWGATVVPLQQQYVGEARPALLVLLGAVGLVLLIACANVANLLLARATLRRREMAVRAALGAGRWRLIRQLLLESVSLAALGGALGLLLGWWGARLLVALAPKAIPLLDQVRLDGPVLAFTMGISLLTGVIFGLAPSLAASPANLREELQEGSARAGAGGGSQLLRRALVVLEVALSVILLVGAGLLIRSFLRLQSVDPGFRAANLLTFRLLLPRRQYREPRQWASFFREAVERIGALPGVQSAGAINFLPFSGMVSGAYFVVEGRPAPEPADRPTAAVTVVTPGYFRTMAVPLLRGRVFTPRDTAESRGVLVINQTMAHLFFPAEDAVGKRLAVQMGNRVPGEIVGVVGDVKHHGFDSPVRPMIFYPFTQLPYQYMVVVVRAASDPRGLAGPVVGAIRSMDPNQAVAQVRPMEEVLSDSVSRARFIMLLLAIFAAVALALAVVGIYGVVSYLVTQRTREIGIRMALGATPRDVLRMVVGHGAILAVAGVAIGLAGSWASTRLMSRLLFGVSAYDPAICGGTAALLTAVSVVAAWIPARRAARVDPMVALRHE